MRDVIRILRNTEENRKRKRARRERSRSRYPIFKYVNDTPPKGEGRMRQSIGLQSGNTNSLEEIEAHDEIGSQRNLFLLLLLLCRNRNHIRKTTKNREGEKGKQKKPLIYGDQSQRLHKLCVHKQNKTKKVVWGSGVRSSSLLMGYI